MANYYYIGTYLTPLSFSMKPEISFHELDTLLHDQLTEKDYGKTLVIRRFFDLLNLRAFWLREELDPRGEMTSVELEEALMGRVGLPDYVYDYLDAYPHLPDRIRHFPLLLAKFFQTGENLNDPFLHNYFNLERELRLVMTGFRAKKLGRDLSVELQYENPEEELIAQLLAEKDAKAFEPPEKFEELKVLFEKEGDHPLALEKGLDLYRFEKIENLVDMADQFSIHRILAYMTQLILVEKWFELDEKKGKQIVETIRNEHGANGDLSRK